MSPEGSSLSKSQEVRNTTSGQFKSLSSEDYGFNRRDRRALEKASRRIKNVKLPQFDKLLPEGQILTQEDDLPFLKTELQQYTRAQSNTLTKIRLYDQFRRSRITDATCKKIIIKPVLDIPVVREMIKEIVTKDKGLMSLMMDTGRMMNNPRNKIFFDPDEEILIDSLIGDDNISGKDILIEVMRARRESIGLMKMQIDWLKERQVLASRKTRIAKKTDIHIEIDTGRETEEELFLAPLQNVLEELPEVSTDLDQEVKEQFLLENWDLFITESLWSSNPNHLTSIPTNSRQETLDAVTALTRGKVSVKPNSILNALEFHLRKDVVQKALATRLKYGPDGIRDWVKIKRGRDRIFFLIPNSDEAKAIFFVEGRDVIYRSI